PHRVAFTFTSDTGATLTRTLMTSDGASFDSDFDALAYEAGAEEVEVQRAFVKATPDFAPGRTITAVRAESYLGDDLRDVAPGGILVPGSGGAAEIPMGDSQQVAESPLVGPTKYVKATLDGGDG